MPFTFLLYLFSAKPITTIEDKVAQQLSDLDLGDIGKDQAKSLEEFFSEKAKIGEMKNEDFKMICELGAGNGGVVAQVLHKPSNIIMARKVRWTNFSQMRYSVIFSILYCDLFPLSFVLFIKGPFQDHYSRSAAI